MARVLSVLIVSAICLTSQVRAEDDGEAIPPPFAPFEHMIGAWKGTGVPRANRIKGWEEKHLWAWKFLKGTPVGMTLEFKGDKSLSRAGLTFDEKTKKYHLEVTTPEDKTVQYVGAMDRAGKALVLEREDDKEGNDRITIRPNSNKIRYQVLFDHQEPGSPSYKNVVEVGLTKEGESFAAGGSAANLPKCIITGGSSTMSISFEGKSYPICCSGCRDEFSDNPTKYVKKALLPAAAGGKSGATVKPASSKGSDSEFDDLLAEPKEAPKKAMTKTRASRPKAAKAAEPEEDAADDEAAPVAEDDSAEKAAALLSQAQSVEKRSKAAAKIFYKRLMKDYPDTPQAKTAAARLKALGG
jgi:YHS domain-containing protein